MKRPWSPLAPATYPAKLTAPERVQDLFVQKALPHIPSLQQPVNPARPGLITSRIKSQVPDDCRQTGTGCVQTSPCAQEQLCLTASQTACCHWCAAWTTTAAPRPSGALVMHGQKEESMHQPSESSNLRGFTCLRFGLSIVKQIQNKKPWSSVCQV